MSLPPSVIPSERSESRNLKVAKVKNYYVYMMCSNNKKVLYIGVTSVLVRRVYEHRNGLIKGFSQKYKTKNLIYYESTNDVTSAIIREKQLKKWRRDKKESLINKKNPKWEDLYEKII